MPQNIKVRKRNKKKASSTDINLLVNTETDDIYVEWDINRIVKALREEGGVGERTAKKIAKSVEQKVLNSGIDKISTSLIRELVDNELFDIGYQKKLEKQTSIGMPKADIDQLIYSKSQENSNISSNNPEAIQFSLAETILKQYALQEVFSEEVADAHRNGMVHLHDLGHPSRLYAFNENTKLLVKANGDVKEMTMSELYDFVIDSPTIQVNETQRVKDCYNLDLYVLDRNNWVNLNRVIYHDEVKEMRKITLNDGSVVFVTNDHGCVVKRDNKVIIIRADEIKHTDEFVKISEESDGSLPNL